MSRSSDDTTPQDHIAALAAEASPILAELGLSVTTAQRLLLDRVTQRDPEVLAWLTAAAEHDTCFRRQVQVGLDSANAGDLVPTEDVEAEAAARRAAIRRQLEGE